MELKITVKVRGETTSQEEVTFSEKDLLKFAEEQIRDRFDPGIKLGFSEFNISITGL